MSAVYGTALRLMKPAVQVDNWSPGRSAGSRRLDGTVPTMPLRIPRRWMTAAEKALGRSVQRGTLAVR